jgi:hypothetical protein
MSRRSSHINRENVAVFIATTVTMIGVLAVVAFVIPSVVPFYLRAWQGLIKFVGLILTLAYVVGYLIAPGYASFYIYHGLLHADEKMGKTHRITSPVFTYAMMAGAALLVVINQLILISLANLSTGFRAVVGWVTDPIMLSEAPFSLWGFMVWALVAYFIGWWISSISADS